MFVNDSYWCYYDRFLDSDIRLENKNARNSYELT